MGKTKSRSRPAHAPAQSTGIATRGPQAQLPQAQLDVLEDRFSDDAFMRDNVRQLFVLQNQAGAVSLRARYEMGRVLRAIKGKRQERGVGAAAEALGVGVQLVYDVIKLNERIPEQTLEKLLTTPTSFSVVNLIAHCDDRATRVKLLRQVLNGEEVTTRTVRGLLQQSANERGKKRTGGNRPKPPKTLASCTDRILDGLSTFTSNMPVLTRTLRDKLTEVRDGELDDKLLTRINQAREQLTGAVNMLREQLREVEMAYAQYNGGSQDDGDDDDLDDDDDDDVLADDLLDDDAGDDLTDTESLTEHEEAEESEGDDEADDEHVTRRESVTDRVRRLRTPRG